MPCRCDHMEPNVREKESVEVRGFLYDLGAIRSKPGYYGNVNSLDKDTEKLCKLCQDLDITKESLELQIWWRDHQKADKKRLEEEQKNLIKEEDKEKALSKLTEYERKLLNL